MRSLQKPAECGDGEESTSFSLHPGVAIGGSAGAMKKRVPRESRVRERHLPTPPGRASSSLSCQGLVPRFLWVRVDVGTGWGRERWCSHAFFSRVKGFLNA